MNYDKAYNALTKVTETEKECKKLIWVGSDGIFSDDESNDLADETISFCSVSYSMKDKYWIVVPQLYTVDCSATFKKASSARAMACFWLYMTDLF